MKYTIGDKIILLSSKEEGNIIDILDDKMVVIQVGGSSFPVYMDQIDFPYFHWFSQKKNQIPTFDQGSGYNKLTPGEEIKKEKLGGQIRMETGVTMSMLPVFQTDGYEDVVTRMKFHLHNETKQDLNMHFQVFLNQQLHMEIKNVVLAFQSFYLTDLLFENLNDSPKFEFTFSLKTPDKKLAPSVQKTWKIKPKQLFDQLNKLQQRQEATINYPLYDKYPERQANDAFDFGSDAIGKNYVSAPQVNLKPETPLKPKFELDLHIEKLMDDWQDLSNLEILAIQLNEFEHYLDLAIAHKQHQMIVIHGVGKGTLREEIHEVLKKTFEVKYFVNQYHPQYGYGATEIFFDI
ncbi:Smr domain-containing protein [Chitinophaga skermanii]|uniref:Smr domain-containing protein n=1 Tax=Chitinophaga skermanii TaxID=331697 RepID=A0A327QSB5_9BACT|nr:Smr/MutS family protein [Chitinophaga skermanii]RAJ06848.1 Smr domain-containing protein [Chitinophaga skermanii]